MGCKQSKERRTDDDELPSKSRRVLLLAAKPVWACETVPKSGDWVPYSDANQEALEAAHAAFERGSCTLRIPRDAGQATAGDDERRVPTTTVEVRFTTMTQVKKGARLFKGSRKVWVPYAESDQRALEAAYSAFEEGSCTLSLTVAKKPGRFAKRGRPVAPEQQVVDVRFKTMTQVKKGAAVFTDKRDVRRRIVDPQEQHDQIERVEVLR